jgi:4'-phosphopantetheinyl transferase
MMPAPLIWREPPERLTLTAHELHVWQVTLDQPEDRVAQWQALLAADERARADRFYFERDRRRYLVARGALRSILGQYLNRAPAELQLAYAAKGKPYLPDEPLHFNVAHSHEMALYAMTLVGEVGVDIEYTQRHVSDIDQIAARFFSANENAVYQALPEIERRAAFFRCWTRKEAFIKAIGEGLSHPLDRFDVTLAPHQPAAILRIEGDTSVAAWVLFHLDLADHYVGAVAVRGAAQRLATWRF